MTRSSAAELISQNLTAIYGYAFARLYDKSDADDLTAEIVLAVLESAERIERDASFWSFAWKVAENTLCSFIRKKERIRTGELPPEELIEHSPSPEDEYIDRLEREDEVYLLRRELSLLTRTNREVSVAYYVDGKSCRDIASEMNLSVEMVKYHLFKTRKLLKEGIGMTRKLGEKSYSPGVFRINFWGDRNHYWKLFENRRLPGSILLAAYYSPLSAEEISIEVGVAMPYLEDELAILVRAGLLIEKNGRYSTNIVILTDEYECEFIKKTEAVYGEYASKVYDATKALLPEIRGLDFTWRERSDNELLWMALNIAMIGGWERVGNVSPIGEPKALGLGGHGWVFGHDNDYAHSHFSGVTMETWDEDGRAWFSAENYKVINPCQRYLHDMFDSRARVMNGAIMGDAVDPKNPATASILASGEVSAIDGKLAANFPVFTEESFGKLKAMLDSVSAETCKCMLDISDRAELLLATHVPEAVRGDCAPIAKIHHRLDVMAIILEHLVADGRLTVPTEKVPICIFGVKVGG